MSHPGIGTPSLMSLPKDDEVSCEVRTLCSNFLARSHNKEASID